jgi:hypothetical membrane protein
VAGRVYAVGAAIAWISGGLTYLIVEAIAAKAFRPHYSYVHNVISDLGVTSSLMNGAFCVQGTLFLVGAILSVRAFETRKAGPFLTLAAANTVGNILIATFHSGSSVHAIGAGLAIVGGNAAILAGSLIIGGPPRYRRVSAGLAAFGLLSFMMFVIELKIAAVNVLPPAVWERCSVYSIIGWQVVTAILCYTRSE